MRIRRGEAQGMTERGMGMERCQASGNVGRKPFGGSPQPNLPESACFRLLPLALRLGSSTGTVAPAFSVRGDVRSLAFQAPSAV